MNRLLSLLCIILLIASCNNGKVNHSSAINDNNGSTDYARLFNVERDKDYSYINIFNEKGETVYRVLICDGKHKRPSDCQADFVLSKPITSIGILSSTHIGFLKSIGKESLINSCSNPQRIYDSNLYSKYKEGNIKNIGSDMKTNIEAILELHPDVVFYTGFESNKNTSAILHKAGIAYIPVTEWKESDILGRSEWVKLFGELLNVRHRADSVFNRLAQRYLALQGITDSITDKPTVMYGNNFKGTWYMPGGKSYVGQILKDAGADYYFSNDTTKGSLHLSIETVINDMQDADYWLSPSANSMAELKATDKHYSIFKAFRSGNVFEYNARVNPAGFNDYWESAVMNPDIVLSDLIKILHPDLLKQHNLYYYKRLE